MIETIRWLGHGGFLIQGPPIVYIDPWRVARTTFHADIILISHDHYDHCSVADVNKLRGPSTRIIGNERVAAQIKNTSVLRPWQSITFERVNIKAIPAYSPTSSQHSKERNGLGFVISMNFYDIYYAGDTGVIPEMAQVHPDIAILPINGSGTLSISEAAEVVDMLQARWVIPCNWGSKDASDGASQRDVQAFKQLIGDRAKVVIPRRLESTHV